MNLLSRADAGVRRADWKFVIDCLQRIIDGADGSLMKRTGPRDGDAELYYSPRRHALERLASLPPEGLRAYRRLYDGKAKRLYLRGKKDHDSQALRAVVNRYLLTQYGDDAADLLASWSLDQGRPGEVVRILTDLLQLHSGSDVPPMLVRGKLAAAWALLGRHDQASSVLDTELQTDKAVTVEGAAARWGEHDPVDLLLTLRPLDPIEREELRAGTRSRSWSVPGGNSARTGWMEAVDPAIDQRIPWRFELPGASVDAWRRVYDDDRTGPVVLPVAQLLADQDRIFVRTKSGCAALRMDDLEPVWFSAAQHESPLDALASATGLTDKQAIYLDEISQSMSLGEGSVFTITRSGEMDAYQYGGRDEHGHRTISWLPQPGLSRQMALGTRLVAWNIRSGEVRWRRGRTDHPDDPLGNVVFRSVPISSEGVLWVLFLRNRDLILGSLDPDNGTLLGSVTLCSLPRIRGEEVATLKLSAADGMVYVPTDQGVLFAVGVADPTEPSLIWASRYGSGQSQEAVGSLPSSHPQSPPVAVGPMVLLAPREGDTVIGFSAADGSILWSVNRNDTSYIVAAEHDRAWLGGRSVLCVSLLNGEHVFETQVKSAPTGRAVLSGTTIHVPTLDGLLSLSSEDGRTINTISLPESATPLGNILCLDDTLFSVDPESARRFPDLARSYPAVRQAYDAHPDRVALAVRLAWLELLQGNPRGSLEIIGSRGSSSAGSTTSSEAQKLAAIRVQAYMSLAEAARKRGDPGDSVLELLEKADLAALNLEDRLRTGLAHSDQLRLMGQVEEAYKRLWGLGFSLGSDPMVASSPNVRMIARLDIAARLEELLKEVSSASRASLQERASEKLAEVDRRLDSGSDRRSLEVIADLCRGTGVAQQTLLRLAGYHHRRGHDEQEEQLLREAASLDAVEGQTVTALMRLARLLSDESPEPSGEAGAVFADLEARFLAVAIPVGVFEQGQNSGLPDPQGSVSDWLTQVRADGRWLSLERSSRVAGGDPLGLTGERAWEYEFQDALSHPLGLVSFASRPAVLDRRVLLQGADRIVRSYDIESGELQWQSELRLPGSSSDGATFHERASEPVIYTAVADGRTAIMRGADGLFAVGLETGRRIWAKETTPTLEDPLFPDYRFPMAAQDGWFVAMPKKGRLTAMRMLDGSTVWERDLRDERVARVWIIGERIVTAGPLLERVHFFHRDSGALVGQFLFEQPDPQSHLVNLIRTDEFVVGPIAADGVEGVVAVDIETGVQAWRVTVDKPLAHLFDAGPGYIGLGLLGGDLRIVEATTGETLLDRRVAGAHAVLDGTLWDGILLAAFVPGPGRGNASQIAAWDVATGEQLWHEKTLRPLPGVSGLLQVVEGLIPMIGGSTEQGRRRKDKGIITLVDARSGKRTGTSIGLSGWGSHVELTGDFVLRIDSEMALIGTGKGILALRLGPSIGQPNRDRENSKEGT